MFGEDEGGLAQVEGEEGEPGGGIGLEEVASLGRAGAAVKDLDIVQTWG